MPPFPGRFSRRSLEFSPFRCLRYLRIPRACRTRLFNASCETRRRSAFAKPPSSRGGVCSSPPRWRSSSASRFLITGSTPRPLTFGNALPARLHRPAAYGLSPGLPRQRVFHGAAKTRHRSRRTHRALRCDVEIHRPPFQGGQSPGLATPRNFSAASRFTATSSGRSSSRNRSPRSGQTGKPRSLFLDRPAAIDWGGANRAFPAANERNPRIRMLIIFDVDGTLIGGEEEGLAELRGGFFSMSPARPSRRISFAGSRRSPPRRSCTRRCLIFLPRRGT